MNRREVLFGASATALLFSGFVPAVQASAPVSMSVTFAPFTQGIRGAYTLNGQVALIGTIVPVNGAPQPELPADPGPGPETPGVTPPGPGETLPGYIPPVPPSTGPEVAAPQRPIAQPSKPSMSVVRVPRGSARPIH